MQNSNSTNSIRVTLLLFFVAASVLPLLLVWFISSTQFASRSTEQSQQQVASIADIHITQIETLVSNAEITLSQTLSDTAILSRLISVLTVEGDWGSVIGLLSDNLLTELETQNTFNEIFIYDLDGNIVVATDNNRLNESISDQLYFSSSVEGSTRNPAYFADDSLQVIITRSLLDRNGTVVGIMAGRIVPEQIYQLLGDESGLGITERNYLVQASTQQLLTPILVGDNYEIGTQRLQSEGIILANNQSSGVGTYENAFGTTVIGAYQKLFDLDVILLTEVAESEALATVRSVTTLIATVTIIAALIGISIGFLVTRSITSPIIQLTTVAKHIVDGDYDMRANITSTNEIGRLSDAFNTMTNRFQELLNTLEERVARRTKELEVARDEAERANQVKTAFLSSMSHELRTPLNAILNFSGFVMRERMGPINEEQKDALQTVIRSGRHLLNLINDILDISKISSGMLVLYESEVNLNQEIDDVVATARGLMDQEEVELILDIEPNMPLIIADSTRLTQIMLNLVSNACKFTEEGYIKLTAKKYENTFIFSVEDTGYGIAVEEKETVFEAFRQAEAGLHQGTGTGLGLPISKNLAEAHGGHLWFETVKGEGSTFHLEIPYKSVVEKTI